jgi:hypothetical protein
MNTLKRIEHRQLEDAVLAHKTEIEAGKWTGEAFAEKISGMMERRITRDNVYGAAGAVGVRFRAYNQGRKGALRSLYEQRKALLALTAEVVRLSAELGRDCSADVLAIVDDKTAEDGV